ncbi:glutathione S-transferase family protein [Pseudomonas gingeri]|nr:glutathione S-transferase family protein [Pseudomonas gingeri]
MTVGIHKLERFAPEKSDGDYFAGTKLSMVDIAVAPVFRYFDILGFEPSHRQDDFPNVFGRLHSAMGIGSP